MLFRFMFVTTYKLRTYLLMPSFINLFGGPNFYLDFSDGSLSRVSSMIDEIYLFHKLCIYGRMDPFFFLELFSYSEEEKTW